MGFSRKLFFVGFLFSFLVSFSSFAQGKSSSDKIRVIISPSGNVESVSQVQVNFSLAVIKLGDVAADQNFPVESNCFIGENGLANGNGYWVDEKTWVYTYEKAPVPNSLCQVNTKSSFKTHTNKNLPTESVSFKTLSSQVLKTFPNEYDQIDAHQYFLIHLNGKADAAWVAQNVYFTIENIGDKVKPIIGTEAEIKELLSELSKKEGDLTWYLDDLFQTENNKDTAKPLINYSHFILLKSDRIFPRGSKVSLKWHNDFSFNVNKAFKANFNCERETAQSDCVPLGQMYVQFSDEISASELKNIYLQKSNGEKIFSTELKTANPKSTLASVNFKGPFLANTKYSLVVNGVKSLNRETLANQNSFPLKISTADLPSLLKVERNFLVLESANPILPVTLRNIENPLKTKEYLPQLPIKSSSLVLDGDNITKILDFLRKIRSADDSKPMQDPKSFKVVSFNVPKKLANQATEVIGVPLKGNGLHFLEFESFLLGQKLNYEPLVDKNYYVRSLALVTNINLTMKYSTDEVLVWATSLDKGAPLYNINVGLFTNNGTKIKDAKTNQAGLAYFKLNASEASLLQKSFSHSGNYGHYSYGFFAFAKNETDYSFIWSNDDEGLENYRFGLSLPYQDEDIIYHAVLERNLLRPKEALRAKLLYRKIERKGLSIPNIDLPKKIQITDTMTDKKTLVSVKWDKTNGSGVIEWKIPEFAQLGAYRISTPSKNALKNKSDDYSEVAEAQDVVQSHDETESETKTFGYFNVEEFKIPNITTQLTALNTPWIKSPKHELEFSAKYLSGGPAVSLPIKVKHSIESSSISIQDEDYADFNWQSGEVKEGLSKYNSERNQNSQAQVNLYETNLDKYGLAKISLQNVAYKNQPQSAVVSVEYKDANGEIKTVTRSYSLLGTNYLVGVRSKSWFQTAESFEYEAALLDAKQKPLANKPITISLFKVDNYSTRKKILGGFYTYESFEEIVKVKDLCTANTNIEGKASCKGSDKSLGGEYVIMASFKDEKNNLISTKMSSYLSGGDYWFGGSDSDRMDLIPFKKSYEPNETAEFQIRGPITEGQLLVTVERKGFYSHFVQEFNQKDPVIRIKILDDWAPNIVVSAILLRGRIDGKVSGTLDLGKPSLKMGMTSIKVGIKRHILDVKVKTNKEVYEPRENIQTSIEVFDQNGKPVNGEIALAAIDEGLLELSQNNTWNLLDKFLSSRAHNVKTAYMMTHVLGKRTLGLKAVPTGGDGSGAAARELFETSLYWNPKLKVVNGKAQVNFKANDSLTGFKVVAIAQAGAEQFGTGSTSIKVNKDIQTYPALAIAVRTLDSYEARFNVRNTKKSAVKLKAQLSVNKQAMPEKEFTLETNQASELVWPVSTQAAQTEQTFELKVFEGIKLVDFIKWSQPVQPVWTMRSFGNSLKQDQDIQIDVTSPKGATQAELQLSALPSLASDIPGVKNFWDNYYYDCFEQRLSRAISLNSEDQFAELMKISSSYIDQNGLIKYYPNSREGSVFLTNYVLQIVHHKGWSLDEDFQSRALNALQKVFNGTLEFQDYYNKKYFNFLRIEILDTLSLYNLSTQEELSTLEYKLEMLPNYYLAHIISILKNTADINNKEELLSQSLQIVRSRTVASSTRLTLKDSVYEDQWGMYLHSDVSEAKLLVNLFSQPEFKDDAGKLILSFLERAKNGYWYNTMANAWAIVTLQNYKDTFEKVAVNGELNWGINPDLKTQKIKDKIEQTRIKFNGDQKAVAKFKGEGKPWVNFLILANPPLDSNRMHGVTIEKTWTPIEVKESSKKTMGDIWEITLKIKSKSEFQWLAVRDPLPPGAMVISEEGSYLTSKRALEYQVFENWFYGEDKIYKYQIRLNQSGTYNLPSTRAEAMYDTDLNGEILNEKLIINP